MFDNGNKVDNIILDVDGVINGTFEGTNTPFPSVDVVKRLLQFQNDGGTLIFCTSKGIYPIVETVKKFGFRGFHIADAGGIIYIVEQNRFINNGFSINQDLLDRLLLTNEYFEIYSDKDWFIYKKFATNIYVSKHKKLLIRSPRIYDSTQSLIGMKASKILFFSENSVTSDKNIQLSSDMGEYNVKWTMSPVLLPANLMVITRKGVSKKDAILKLAKDYSINLTRSLGVGDHHSDWKFMSLCTFKGVMGNSTSELKEMANDRIDTYIGGDVDEDGVIDIMDYFKV